MHTNFQQIAALPPPASLPLENWLYAPDPRTFIDIYKADHKWSLPETLSWVGFQSNSVWGACGRVDRALGSRSKTCWSYLEVSEENFLTSCCHGLPNCIEYLVHRSNLGWIVVGYSRRPLPGCSLSVVDRLYYLYYDIWSALKRNIFPLFEHASFLLTVLVFFLYSCKI